MVVTAMAMMVVALVVVMIVVVMALMIAVVVAFVVIVGMVLVAVTLMVVGMGYTPARRGRKVNLRTFGCRGPPRWREQEREYPSHRFRTWSESPQVWSTSGHTLAIDKQIPKGRKAARAYLPPNTNWV